MNNRINFKKEKLIIFTKDYDESNQIYELLIEKYNFNFKLVRNYAEKFRVYNEFIDIEIIKFKSISNALRAVKCNDIIFTDYVVKNMLYKIDKDVIAIIYSMIAWNNYGDFKSRTFFLDDLDYIYNLNEENYDKLGGLKWIF